MRLDRLEISGFKSFSDRSELAFDGGVTAIVGPNGCGKSNVADALTWVLGEQSAKSLRGDKMEDVIFSGSDARKPTGAAEVTLRLSGVPLPPRSDAAADAHGAANGNGNGNGNGQGHLAAAGDAVAFDPIQAVRDVEVTRRLYRSGESEYLIDGAQCRLRDVHELLMDTGLGAKAYSIIEQGKIGMILSSRPTDRRQLIEEAAGITKYKARRRAAELKLDAAQQNLTRLDDIVFEVEKQCGSLKRQAGRARRFQRLRDEMRRWEKVLFARRYRHLAEHIESARARLASAREDETASTARLSEVETELARVRIELAQAEQDATRGSRGRARRRARRQPPAAAAGARRPAGVDARGPRRRAGERAGRAGGTSRAGSGAPRRTTGGDGRGRAGARRRRRRRPRRRRDLHRRPGRDRTRRAGSGALPRRRLRGDQHGHGVDDGDRARRRRARAHGRAPGPARRRSRGPADRTRPRGRSARPRHARPAGGAVGAARDPGVQGRPRSRSGRCPRRARAPRAGRPAGRAGPRRPGRAAGVARGDGHRPGRVRRGGADAPGRGPRRGRPARRAGRLPRRRPAVRARGRGRARRPAAARGGGPPGPGARRLRAGAQPGRRPLRVHRHRRAGPAAAVGARDPAARGGAAAGCRHR